MKRLLWALKAGFLCSALFVLLGGYTSRVVAQDPLFELDGGGGGGKCIAAACAQGNNNTCVCDKRNGTTCTGCFVDNGGTGCGKCTE